MPPLLHCHGCHGSGVRVAPVLRIEFRFKFNCVSWIRGEMHWLVTACPPVEVECTDDDDDSPVCCCRCDNTKIKWRYSLNGGCNLA